MNHLNEKEPSSIRVYVLVRDIGAIIHGLGFGMLITFMLLPEDVRHSFSGFFFFAAWSCVVLGFFRVSLAMWLRRTIAGKEKN